MERRSVRRKERKKKSIRRNLKARKSKPNLSSLSLFSLCVCLCSIYAQQLSLLLTLLLLHIPSLSLTLSLSLSLDGCRRKKVRFQALLSPLTFSHMCSIMHIMSRISDSQSFHLRKLADPTGPRSMNNWLMASYLSHLR
jgi:hypothetical protein